MFHKKEKTTQKNKYAACLLSVLLLTGALCGCAGSGRDAAGAGENSDSVASQSSGTDVAKTAEEGTQETAVVFEGQDIEGNAVTSEILSQSKLTMINVWATYCNPCLREMPELGELAGEYDADDFQIIGVISDVPQMVKGVDEEKVEKAIEEAKSLIEKTGANYPHLLLNTSLYNALLTEVTAVPTTFFIDAQGNVLEEVIGARDKESWKKLIDGLLEDL